MIYFILGGARSGKSRLAQNLVNSFEQQNVPVYYIATATAFDDEMKKRIEYHQNDRPQHWKTIETPIYLADCIQNLSEKPCIILLDCLTLWINNLLLENHATLLRIEIEKLLNILENFPSNATLILVSNETGLGVIPLGQLTRKFVDESGFLHQNIAKIADKVIFCIAGLTINLKD